MLLVPFAEAGKDAKGKKKPDLVPTAGKLVGKPYSFIGERLRIEANDVTANEGKGRAGPTITRVFLERGKELDELADRAVGALKPGKSDNGVSDSKGRNRFQPGRHPVVVCVDANEQEDEANEKNNCGQAQRLLLHARPVRAGRHIHLESGRPQG